MTQTVNSGAPDPTAPTSKPKPLGAVLVAVGIPMFMVTLDNLVVTNALPVIRTELGASLADLQWFVNAYTLSFAALMLSASALGDRIGRRRVYLAGIALFVVASAACALSTTPGMLIAARAVQGVGAAAVMPLSLTLLSAAVPDRMRSAAIGIWGGIAGLGVAVGPVVGGAVVDGLNWQWIFWLNVPIGLAALPFVASVLSESRGVARRLDLLGLGLSAGGLFAVVWGIIHAAEDGWTSGPVLAALIGGVVALVGFVGWEQRSRDPMLPLRMFSSRGLSVSYLVTFGYSAGVFGSVFLLAQFFQVVQGYSPLEAGVRTLPWTMAPMVVAPLAGLVIDRVGARTLIGIGQVLQAVGLGWMAVVTTVDVGYGSFVPPFVLAGVGFGLTLAPTATIVMASAAPADQGMASGVNSTVREVGVAMGVALLASVFASRGSYADPQQYVDGLRAAVWVGAAITAVAAVIALFLPRRADPVS